jgi:group I intron endonuclease
MIGIYKITSPSGKIYIGQSIDIERRFSSYKKLRCKLQPAIYNSLVKYGVDNHIFEIITECKSSELNVKERHYQEMYFVLGEGGLNCNLTSCSEANGVVSLESRKKMSEAWVFRNGSEETRAKLSLAWKGRKHTEQSKLKMSIVQSNRSESTLLKLSVANTGKKMSVESRKKMSLAGLNRKVSLETKAKMSKASLGVKKSKEASANMAKAKSKLVLDNNSGIYYESVKSASYHLNINWCTLRNMMVGNRKNNTGLIYV